MWTPESAGIDGDALRRYIDEQIYTLPGTEHHRDEFTVLVTGSRGTGTHVADSDVDVDVVCPQDVYESVQRASYEAGITGAANSFFCTLKGDDWGRYYGPEFGRPHFSLVGLDRVRGHFADFDDVWIWIWTSAKAVVDPGGQFQGILDAWQGYPIDVLVRKIKYRWLMAAYCEIEVYPMHARGDGDLLAAATAVTGAVNELLRLCYLVEGKPFPYTEKLMSLASTTRLGRELGAQLQQSVALAVGSAGADMDAWQRLERASGLLCSSDTSPEARALEAACAEAMIAAGVEPEWVEADYNNIDELLLGDLGPMP